VATPLVEPLVKELLGIPKEMALYDMMLVGYPASEPRPRPVRDAQDRLVRMLIEITKAQLLNYHLGRMLDEKRAAHAQISLAKLNNVRQAMKVAPMARDILGARGILAEHQVIRQLCDLEAQGTLEGTENIHTLILGHDVTGIPAF
jgi:glutaryl-CoA dehydrogenase